MNGLDGQWNVEVVTKRLTVSRAVRNAWTRAIKTGPSGWLREHINKLPVAKEQVEDILNHLQM